MKIFPGSAPVEHKNSIWGDGWSTRQKVHVFDMGILITEQCPVKNLIRDGEMLMRDVHGE